MKVAELFESEVLPTWDVKVSIGGTGNDHEEIKVHASTKAGALAKAKEWAKDNGFMTATFGTPSKIEDVQLSNHQIKSIVESFLFEEEPIPTPTDGSPVTPPTTPPGGTTPAPGAPHDHGGHNTSAGLWFQTFASQLAWLYSATRISKRLKELGIKGEGAKRVKNAIKIAKQNVSLLLSNPGWRAAPNYEFVKASKGTAAKLNKQVSSILTKELSKIPKSKIYK